MNDDLTVLRCWACGGEGWRDESRNTRCHACGGTGSIFWVYGRVYPYTPAGEKQARKATMNDIQ
jgi:DnaJ-class molecular chaperone